MKKIILGVVAAAILTTGAFAEKTTNGNDITSTNINCLNEEAGFHIKVKKEGIDKQVEFKSCSQVEGDVFGKIIVVDDLGEQSSNTPTIAADNTCTGGFDNVGAKDGAICTEVGLDELSEGWLNLTETEWVYLSDNNLTNVDGLSNLTSVGEIEIDNNYNLTNIDGLSNLTSVEWLSLHRNNLTNIDGLSNLTEAVSVSLFENNLTNVDGLSNLTSVEWLELNDNNLTNVDGLSNLTSVNELSLEENQLTNVDGLSNLTSVEILDLDRNQLTNVDGLSNLTNINGLSLSNNNLTNINGLSNLTEANKIYLTYNDNLTNINGLSNLTNVNGVTLDDKDYTTKMSSDAWLCNDGFSKVTGITNKSQICED